jgi:DNA-directed RNA polymerase subunit beta'
MSLEVKNKKGEGMIFSSINEINSALANNEIELQTIIGISTNAFSKKQNLQDNKILITSVGKVLFNSILPSDYDFINSNNLNISENDILGNGENINDAIKTRLLPRGLTKTDANKIINVIHGRYENDEIGQYIDNIKNFGFKYVTKFSETFSIFDLPSYKNKKQYIDITNKKIELINDKFAKGLLTDDERYLNVINS